MSNDSRNNAKWLIPEFERRHKRAWRIFAICIILLVGLAVGYLLTFNTIFEWLAVLPACGAFWCLGYQGAMMHADDHVELFASQVSRLIEIRLSEARERKRESVESH